MRPPAFAAMLLVLSPENGMAEGQSCDARYIVSEDASGGLLRDNLGTIAVLCFQEFADLEKEMQGALRATDRERLRKVVESYEEFKARYEPIGTRLRERAEQPADWQRSGGGDFEGAGQLDFSAAEGMRHAIQDRLAKLAETTTPRPLMPERFPPVLPKHSQESIRTEQRANQGEDQLRQQPRPDPAQSGQVANDYLSVGKPRDAARVLTRLIDDGAENADAYLLRGEARRLQGDWLGAYEDAQKARELGSSHPYAADLLGTARMQLARRGALPAPKAPDFGKSPEEASGPASSAGPGARQDLSAAWPARSGSSQPRTLLDAASSKLRLKDYRGALLDLSAFLNKHPRSPAALGLRARALNWSGNPQAALSDAEQALALAPDDPAALRERAYALVQLGRYDEALKDIERAISLEPRNGLGYLYRALALEKLGRAEEALADYERAAALDPTLRAFYDDALAARSRKAPPGPSARLKAWGLAGLFGLPLLLLGFLPLWRRVAALTTKPRAPAEEPAQTLAAGAVLGGVYEVGRVLGRGGMGVVYEARDAVLQRTVAIKQLRTPEGSSEELELLLREARVVAALRHPNLVQIHTVIEDGGRFYLVFEHVEGQPLDQALAERGRFSPKEARPLLAGICAALDYAHSQRVIHRDLKPGNVMRAGDGGARVMDFGIAHRARFDAGATQTSAWGTPPYMAPEQAVGSVSRESDLYALGVLLYELLTGERPFAGEAHADKLAGRYTAATRLVAGLPVGLDPFFARALAPDPGRRFHSGAELLGAFDAVI